MDDFQIKRNTDRPGKGRIRVSAFGVAAGALMGLERSDRVWYNQVEAKSSGFLRPLD